MGQLNHRYNDTFKATIMLYTSVKFGSHGEKISACKTPNHAGHLTRPFSATTNKSEKKRSGLRDYVKLE